MSIFELFLNDEKDDFNPLANSRTIKRHGIRSRITMTSLAMAIVFIVYPLEWLRPYAPRPRCVFAA